MTEGGWLSVEDPVETLEWLRDCGRLTDRKARLFCVAVCHRISPLLTDAPSRHAVAVAERYADGKASPEARAAAWEAAAAVADAAHINVNCHAGPKYVWAAAEVAAVTAEAAMSHFAGSPGVPVHFVAINAADAVAEAAYRKGGWHAEAPSSNALLRAERAAQARILRELFGPLSFRAVPIAPWWQTRAAVALATALYEERRFEDTPILADALDEAGCNDEEILGHLRQQERVHARGCWCLDLILGKE